MGQSPGPWTDQAVLPGSQEDRGGAPGAGGPWPASRELVQDRRRTDRALAQLAPTGQADLTRHRRQLSRRHRPLHPAEPRPSQGPEVDASTIDALYEHVRACGASAGIAGRGFGGAARRCGLVSGIDPGPAPTKWCTSWTASTAGRCRHRRSARSTASCPEPSNRRWYGAGSPTTQSSKPLHHPPARPESRRPTLKVSPDYLRRQGTRILNSASSCVWPWSSVRAGESSAASNGEMSTWTMARSSSPAAWSESPAGR